jgi:arylsulfatase A-like enzyme
VATVLDRREFLKVVGAGAAAMALPRWVAAESGPAPGSRKPNIIFILSDDLGYADLGCYGQKLIKTPKIDQMAAEGVRFTQAYCGSSVCAPSRCTLMTGLHTGHAFIRANHEIKPEGQLPIPADTPTVATWLKAAGYATALVGKWGLGGPPSPGETESPGEPLKHGFDHYFGYLCQVKAHEYYPEYLWRDGKKVELDGKTYSHDLFTAEALKYVRENKDRPFFLYLAYTIPHGKYQVPSDEPYTKESWPQPKKNYAAMITRMDADVGRLLALLKECGIDENTIVFFTSDNGAAQQRDLFDSCGPLRGIKRDLYEGGIRTPMVVRWPGRIKPGTTSDYAWAFWDFAPTAVDLAGAKPPEKIDGLSILPVLEGREQRPHEYLYWEFYEGGFKQAVRMGDWKAVRIGPRGPLELYDLKSDIGEKTDVAAAHPDVIAKIEELIKASHVDSAEFPIPAGDGKGKAAGKAAAKGKAAEKGT